MNCDWIDVFKALFTPAIAFLALVIAFSQYKVNETKLKLDKFSLRIEVYNGVRQYLDNFFRKGAVDPEEILELKNLISRARWLFNQEVTDYLSEDLLENSLRLYVTEKNAASTAAQEHAKASHVVAEEHMLEQHQKLDSIMAKYLSF